MSKRVHSDIRMTYRNQLRKFERLGLGNKTEHGVEVTERLLDITRKRLMELQNQSIRKLRKPVDSDSNRKAA